MKKRKLMVIEDYIDLQRIEHIILFFPNGELNDLLRDVSNAKEKLKTVLCSSKSNSAEFQVFANQISKPIIDRETKLKFMNDFINAKGALTSKLNTILSKYVEKEKN